MAKICETCDTRNRLCMCNGNESEFRYCVRRTGSLSNVPSSITPFNKLEEIFNNPIWDELDHSSVVLSEEYYGTDKHMRLLWGRWGFDIKAKEDNQGYPVGYVIC